MKPPHTPPETEESTASIVGTWILVMTAILLVVAILSGLVIGIFAIAVFATRCAWEAGA